MPRMTITLSEERQRALKEAAARRKKSIGQLIDESLEFYGIKTSESAAALVAAACATIAGAGFDPSITVKTSSS